MSSVKIAALGAALLGSLVAAGQAQAQNTQVGVLRCELGPSVGMIVASQRQLACTFRNARGEPEIYTGAISRLGIDIGATGGGEMAWAVFAPSGRMVRGALAGNYGGASAEATVGAGLGANVLVGGSDRSVALQPVSLQGQTGLNLAIGVADLQLRYEPPPARRPG